MAPDGCEILPVCKKRNPDAKNEGAKGTVNKISQEESRNEEKYRVNITAFSQRSGLGHPPSQTQGQRKSPMRLREENTDIKRTNPISTNKQLR